MELSNRLRAVASLATVGYITADIGTDHAYIPIYLIESGIIPRAIAADINKAPLKRAGENVKAAGLTEKIELRLSDGLGAFKPGEADTLILSGMGGRLIMRILADHIQAAKSFKECILQPQSAAAAVRAFLLKRGFLFVKEDMIFEDGKFYPMMKVIPIKTNRACKTEKWNETEIRYGKLLLESRNTMLKSFLEKEIMVKENVMEALKLKGTAMAKKRLSELEKELGLARKGLEYYAL